jgi:hypothetical protein
MSDRGLYVVSHFPGRLRLRSARLRQEPEVREAAVRRLRGEAGVTSVSASPLTGSILILYDPRQTQADMLVGSVVAEGGPLSVVPDAREHAHGTEAATVIAEAFGGADRGLFRAAGGRLDLRTAVPGALALGGIATLLLGRRMLPQWYDLVFWGYVTFNNLNLAGRMGRGERRPGSDER